MRTPASHGVTESVGCNSNGVSQGDRQSAVVAPFETLTGAVIGKVRGGDQGWEMG